MEKVEILDTGFSTADADSPEFTQEKGDLLLHYNDWQEKLATVFFVDTVAFKWQMALSLRDGERDDCCYKVLNSLWLQEQIEAEVIRLDEGYNHYKFNFNEIGQLEVIAQDFKLRT